MAKVLTSRRMFVKLAAATGAAATFSASVQPAALFATEDNSTQEEVKKIRSHCRECGKMECPTWVWVKDGRVVDITGDETSVTSMGHLCSKGKSAMQSLYHPDRLHYPMKRTNPKGEDPGWVRISWVEAIEESAKALQEQIDKFGGPSIKTYHGTSRLTSYASMSVGNCLGTPNAGCTAGQICKGPREIAGQLTCYPAHWCTISEHPEVLFQWGTNQEVSNYDTACRVIVDTMVTAKKSICIGPRLQNLGKEADVWVPLRPGTDDALGIALLNIIVNEMGTYDIDFVKRWSNGPFLYVEDMEPTGFTWGEQLRSGTYNLNISTRLLKESDLIEGGNPRRFMVWDSIGNKMTYFDAVTALWEGETEYIQPTARKVGKGYLLEDGGFGVDIDPALDGEYEVTLKDGRKVKAVPVFRKFSDCLAEWPVERAAEHCCVDGERIRQVAEIYGAKLMQGGVSYNLAMEHCGNAIQACRIPLLLSGLMNNLDTPGGNRGGDPTPWLYNTFLSYAATIAHPSLPVDVQNKIAGFEKYPLLPWIKTIGGAATHYDQASATDMTLTGEPYPITAMISVTGQHFHSANATKNWEATKMLDFFVCFELWHIPMLELADIALPAAHFFEVGTVRMSQGGEQGFGAQVQIVPRLGEARWDSAMIVQIVKQMGIEWWPSTMEKKPPWFPTEWLSIVWPDEKQLMDFQVLPMMNDFATPGPEGKTIHCEDWDDFVAQYEEHGQWDTREISPLGYYRRYMNGNMRKNGLPGFATPTTKFELLSTILETYHPGDELPLVREPVESPISTPDVYEEYPIILTSGRRIPVYFHSEGRQKPYTRELAAVPTFQINPETAAELGIESGDWCWIESRRGKIRQVADVFYGIAPGVIEAEHAWWYPELPAPTHGWDLSNINCLVDDKAGDPIMGASQLRAYLVKVYKATPENSPFGNPVTCAPEDGTPIISEATDERLKQWMPVYEEGGQE